MSTPETERPTEIQGEDETKDIYFIVSEQKGKEDKEKESVTRIYRKFLMRDKWRKKINHIHG